MEAAKFAPSSIVRPAQGWEEMEDRGERVEGGLERLREGDRRKSLLYLGVLAKWG